MSAGPLAAEIMRHLSLALVVIVATVLGATYLFIREPYKELSLVIAAAPEAVQPPMLRSALIAAEEPREYSGATFTDQLVKFAAAARTRGLARVADAILLRVALDARFDQEQVLAAYSEQVYVGHGVYGVHQGAAHYFGKPASDLSVAEAVTLAGLVRSPQRYSPLTAPDRARRRRDDVLAEMNRRGMISDDQLRAAMAEPLLVVAN